MKTTPTSRYLPSPVWTVSLALAVAAVGVVLRFEQLIATPALLIVALVVTALLSLTVLGRVRTARRWRAAVDAYAEREIARSGRFRPSNDRRTTNAT